MIIFKIYITFNSLSIILFFPLISKICSQISTKETNIQKYCLKAETSIKSFFSELKELDAKFLNYEPHRQISSEDLNNMVKLVLLDDEVQNEYDLTLSKSIKKLKNYITIGFVLTFIIMLNLEIHFFLRLFTKKNEKFPKPTFINFFKISPFYWIYYLIYNENKREILYKNYINGQNPKYNKFTNFVAITLFFIFSVFIFVASFYNNDQLKVVKTKIYNLVCTAMRLLNGVEEGRYIQKDGTKILGLKNINNFINDMIKQKTIFQNYFDDYDNLNSFSKEIIQQWNNYVKTISKIFSDQNFNYYFENYPSEPVETCNFDESFFGCLKYEYQSEEIYNFYPHTNKNKKLYYFNNIFNEIIENYNTYLNNFSQKFFSLENSINSLISNEKLAKIFSTTYNVVELYLYRLHEIDKTILHDPLVTSYLGFISSYDFIVIILIGIILLLACMFIEYKCMKKCIFGRFIISMVFINILFFILLLSFDELKNLIILNKCVAYIGDVSKGVNFIFNENYEEYMTLFTNSNYINIQNISLIIDNKNMNNNIFNLWKYYINNEDELQEIINNQILIINQENLKKMKNNLNDLMLSYDQTITEEDFTETFNNTKKYNELYRYSYNLSKIIAKDLEYSTSIISISDEKVETVSNYLSYINSILRKSERKKNGIIEIPCDEGWNFTSTDNKNIFYKNKDESITPNNICNNKSPSYTLNFKDFSIEEIEERYGNLKKNNSEIYYEIMYYFNAIENVRNSNVMKYINNLKQVIGVLTQIQKELINNYNNMVSTSIEVIEFYNNISSKYESDKTLFSYKKFLKNDIKFFISEIDLSFLYSINKLYKFHLFANIVCFIYTISMIFLYHIFAIDIHYYHMESDNTKIENAAESPKEKKSNSKKFSSNNKKLINSNSNSKVKIGQYYINENEKKKSAKPINNNIINTFYISKQFDSKKEKLKENSDINLVKNAIEADKIMVQNTKNTKNFIFGACKDEECSGEYFCKMSIKEQVNDEVIKKLNNKNMIKSSGNVNNKAI